MDILPQLIVKTKRHLLFSLTGRMSRSSIPVIERR